MGGLVGFRSSSYLPGRPIPSGEEELFGRRRSAMPGAASPFWEVPVAKCLTNDIHSLAGFAKPSICRAQLEQGRVTDPMAILNLLVEGIDARSLSHSYLEWLLLHSAYRHLVLPSHT